MRLLIRIAAVGVALCGCGALLVTKAAPQAAAAPKRLEMRTLRGTVVRMGSLHGEPLYGVRLRAFVCSRSSAEADRTVPTSFRIAHYVTSGRTATKWGKPFRALDNNLYWVVSLGERGGPVGTSNSRMSSHLRTTAEWSLRSVRSAIAVHTAVMGFG